MKAPAFWWWAETSPAAIALAPAARLYGAVARWRMDGPPRFRPPVPVICIGNFVVGGAGKTPAAIAVARMARALGHSPGFVSKGYGRLGNETLLVDPATMNAAAVGDEPLLLAAVAPAVVASDRTLAARRLLRENVDLIVMDDGFQSAHLARDVSLVLVDAGAGIGNGRVFPAGPLRAPLAPQLTRADAVVIVGEGAAGDLVVRAAARAGRPVWRAALKPAPGGDWASRPVLAFAGIGRPSKFFASLEAAGATIAKAVPFDDHHRYSAADADGLVAAAEAGGLRLVTTEKDMARLAGTTGRIAGLRDRAEAFPVVLEFENPSLVEEMIAAAFRKAPHTAG